MDDQKVWEALDRLAVVVTGIEVGMPRKQHPKRTRHQHNNASIQDDDTVDTTQETGSEDDDQSNSDVVDDRIISRDNQYADGRDPENGSDNGSDSDPYGEDETDDERSDGEISKTNPDKAGVPNEEDEYSVKSKSHLRPQTKFQSRPNRRVYFSNFGPNSY